MLKEMYEIPFKEACNLLAKIFFLGYPSHHSLLW